MNNSARVGEIFQTAGAAFNKLGELTMQLKGAGGGAGGAKWTDQEIAMLHRAVHNFATDINAISETMKNKTVNQIKGALQKKAFDDAGIMQQGPTTNLTTTNNVLTPQNKLQEMEHSSSQQASTADPSMVSGDTSTTPTSVQTSASIDKSGQLLHQLVAGRVPDQQSTHLNPSTSSVTSNAQSETLSAVSAPSSEEAIGGTSNANVTLNMLNASENEVDVESLGPPSNNRLDFGSPT